MPQPVAQGQPVVQAGLPPAPAIKEPPKSLHAEAVAAYLFGLSDEEKGRFERGASKRRAHFLKHADEVYTDPLDSVSVVERMEALRRIIGVFERDPQATTDESATDVQVKAINAVLEMLEQEDMPKSQALSLRALASLYPAPPTVEPPIKKDPKEKAKSKFTPPPKRMPNGRRGVEVKQVEQVATQPQIVERTTDPILSAVFAVALKFTAKDVAWYVRIWALRLVAKLAPWTLILDLASRKEEPNALSAVPEIAKLLGDERDDRMRYVLAQTLFKMQAFAHLGPKVRGPIMISLADRMMTDPCINIRILVLNGLGPLVNIDAYSREACDRESFESILCTLHDEDVLMRCLAMETLVQMVPKKDDQSILNQVTEQIKDLKKNAFNRRRLSAANSILPLLGKEVPPELQPALAAESPRESAAQQELPPANEGRELSVLVIAGFFLALLFLVGISKYDLDGIELCCFVFSALQRSTNQS